MLDQMTERQKSFISSLLEERVVPSEVRDVLASDHISKREASNMIDALLRSPKLEPVFRADNPIRARLEALPKSKYAIPMWKLSPVLSDSQVHGEYMFVEIRQYQGTTYMRRLAGSPGDFTRYRMSNDDILAVCTVLDADTLTYIQNFGRLYTCCGKCGAPLTDDVSRARVLGPDCARMLGVA